MSDAWGAQPPSPFSGQMSGSLSDVNNTLKGNVQNAANVAKALLNAFPPATTSASPVATGVSLGTTGAVVVASNPARHGLLLQNVGATATVYVFPTLASPAPTLTSLAGAISIAIGSTFSFPPSVWPNVNAGFSAFAGTGSGNPLTAWEFY